MPNNYKPKATIRPLTPEEMTILAGALDVPLIYVMKMDAAGVLSRKNAMPYLLYSEYTRIKAETGDPDFMIYPSLIEHYRCTRDQILYARNKFEKKRKRKTPNN